ncbi:hypothetical protein [Streptomyces sp. NPDC004721]
MDQQNLLRSLVPDWPQLPSADQCIPDDRPAPEQWPPLTLTWRDIPPTVLPDDSFNRYRTDSLLQVTGAFEPAATVSWGNVPGARYGHGWIWRCRIYVVGATCDSAASMSFTCTRFSRSTTRDGARDAARDHITREHPDAAVPYLSRHHRAATRWS